MKKRDTKGKVKRKFPLHDVPCSRCGSPTPTRSSFALCDLCRAENARDKYARDKFRYLQRNIGAQYVVVFNPNKEFGYQVNAIFTRTEAIQMLLPENQSFDLGMILKRDNHFYRVDLVEGKQKLVQIEYIPSEPVSAPGVEPIILSPGVVALSNAST